jgi:hypothetical protein
MVVVLKGKREMTEYRMLDTKRPDGCYVTFEQKQTHDEAANPRDYLFQDDDYRAEDQARIEAWRADEWHFVGIQAVAHVLIVRNGTGTSYTLTSPGLWGIESDSGQDYFDEVFEEEKATLLADLTAMGAAREG